MLRLITAAIIAAALSNTAHSANSIESVSDDAPSSLIVEQKAVDAQFARSFGFYSSPGFQIGSTYHDTQHNARMARQIVVGGGWVHNIWTHLPGASLSNRKVQYFAWQLGGAGTVFNPDVDSSTGAGYCSLDFDPNSNSPVAGYHHTASGGTRAARATGLATGVFSPRFTFPNGNCQGINSQGGTDGAYIWPTIAVDFDGPNTFIHVVSTESAPAAGDMQSIVYSRSNLGMSAPYATCATFIDSVQTISPIIAADPNSNKVSIAYSKPRQYSSQTNADAAYRESTDLGLTWGPLVNVSQYASAETERSYGDVNAMYTSDGCLHVAWQATYFDSGNGTTSFQKAKLIHWDNCNQCKTLVLDAPHEIPGCNVGTWQRNISRMNMSECTTGGDKRLYVTYTMFGDSADCTQLPGNFGPFHNGELQMQVSSTNGQTWGPPINLTNTYTPNSAPGEGASENWSSSAMYVTDSLRIQYILDLDAGRITGTEGSWQNNPVMNMSTPCVAMTPYAKLAVTNDSIAFPFVVILGSSIDTSFTFRNDGNEPLSYTRTVEMISTSGSVSFPDQAASGVIPAGCNSSDTITIVANAVSSGLTHAVIHYVYDTGSGLDSQLVQVLFTAIRSYCCLHGDADNNGIITISDAVYLINYIFAGGTAPASECLADANCDCMINISDAVYEINYIFAGGTPLPSCCPSCLYDW